MAHVGTAGTVFFGSLCVGTFGLGCWQTSRYFEKQQLIEARQTALAREPHVGYAGDFQRLELQGRFRHDLQVLVGPRALPSGTRVGANKASAPQGMSTSPQGYFVVTPLETKDGTVVWTNRGWVPRSMVQSDPSNRRRQVTETWSQPSGQVQVLAVPVNHEQPRFLVAQHDFSSQPPKLYWMDPSVLKGNLVTAIDQDEADFPAAAHIDQVGKFPVTPATHAGYAVTWYGLSTAGVYMTRMLLKGRR